MKKIVVNCETGVTEEIDLTPEEITELEASQAAAVAQQELDGAAALAKETARASALAKLSALGLTDEEIAAL
jgi:hypothetical protein